MVVSRMEFRMTKVMMTLSKEIHQVDQKEVEEEALILGQMGNPTRTRFVVVLEFSSLFCPYYLYVKMVPSRNNKM